MFTRSRAHTPIKKINNSSALCKGLKKGPHRHDRCSYCCLLSIRDRSGKGGDAPLPFPSEPTPGLNFRCIYVCVLQRLERLVVLSMALLRPCRRGIPELFDFRWTQGVQYLRGGGDGDGGYVNVGVGLKNPAWRSMQRSAVQAVVTSWGERTA